MQGRQLGLNEQNPERGIETIEEEGQWTKFEGLNEQNPERGIETGDNLPISTPGRGRSE